MAGTTLQAQIVVGGEHETGGLSDVLATARHDKDGKYQVSLAALVMGNYVISAMAPNYGAARTEVTAADLEVPAAPAGKSGTSAATAKAEKQFVLNPANRTVQGVVKDKQGRPLAGAIVMGHPTGYRPVPLCAVTDAKGHFDFAAHRKPLRSLSVCPGSRPQLDRPGYGRTSEGRSDH